MDDNKVDSMKKKEVPQINSKTGLSYDYKNEFQIILTSIELYQKGIIGYEKMRDKFYSIKTYTERFPFNEYNDIVNKFNEKKIKHLDIIVNCMRKIPKIFNTTEAITHQGKRLIYEGERVINGK